MRISIIGSGNVATQIGLALEKAGHHIVEIAGRNPYKTQQLANLLNTAMSQSISEINTSVDLIVITVSDNSIEEVVHQLPDNKAIVVHTAGSIPMMVLDKFRHHGVIYPLQTLSIQKTIDMQKVPFLIESNDTATEKTLTKLTQTISQHVTYGTSNQRQQLHLAAVFACNFTNHLYAIAEELLKDQGLSFDLLLPLIDETTAKVHTLSPQESQTGPAIRQDTNVMQKHIDTLEKYPQYQDVYRQLSDSIINLKAKNAKK